MRLVRKGKRLASLAMMRRRWAMHFTPQTNPLRSDDDPQSDHEQAEGDQVCGAHAGVGEPDEQAADGPKRPSYTGIGSDKTFHAPEIT